jgi:hypothetical protein
MGCILKSGKESGATLVVVLVIACLAMIIAFVTFKTTIMSSKKSGGQRQAAVALNIAEAGKEHAIARVKGGYRPSEGQNDVLYTDQPFGAGTYSVSCSSNVKIDTFRIRSYGTANSITKGIEIMLRKTGIPTISLSGIMGALTCRDSVEFTGTQLTDGRGHKSNGDLNGQDGTFAVSSAGVIDPSGSSDFAGNGCAPSHKDPCVNALQDEIDTTDAEDRIPATPEDVLGVPDGALDQYICEPNNTYTGAGIWYVNGDAGNVSFDNASGIIIIHNTTGTANLKVGGHSTFKGLIITDNLNKLAGNGTIIGAVIMLGTTDGKAGAGTAEVLYCKDVLDSLSQYSNATKEDFKVVSWREL